VGAAAAVVHVPEGCRWAGSDERFFAAAAHAAAAAAAVRCVRSLSLALLLMIHQVACGVRLVGLFARSFFFFFWKGKKKVREKSAPPCDWPSYKNKIWIHRLLLRSTCIRTR
jgi:hypothetical protein